MRVAAIEALIDLLSFLDKPTLKNEVVPLLKRFCDWSLKPGGQDAVSAVARLLGRMCYELKGTPNCYTYRIPPLIGPPNLIIHLVQSEGGLIVEDFIIKRPT